MKPYVWQTRVYYEDTDAGGVVYYANYLKFMERARTEWLRSLGVEQDTLVDEMNVLFAVRSVSIDYKKPARFNDSLTVTAEPNALKPASILFKNSQGITFLPLFEWSMKELNAPVPPEDRVFDSVFHRVCSWTGNQAELVVKKRVGFLGQE
ncbi:MAG: YbgC/FadM family acyl-CoA thioesterase, partial [Gammaproteobacteria bacterium]